MSDPRHIFIQMDTSGLLAAIGNNAPTNEQVREYATINDQGSMALGNPIETFAIPVESDEDLYFTILPLVLYSYHTLYFTDFKVLQSNGGITVPTDITVDGHQVSLKVPIAQVAKGGLLNFSLYAALEYQSAGETVQVPLCIDPVLRANQGNG